MTAIPENSSKLYMDGLSTQVDGKHTKSYVEMTFEIANATGMGGTNDEMNNVYEFLNTHKQVIWEGMNKSSSYLKMETWGFRDSNGLQLYKNTHFNYNSGSARRLNQRLKSHIRFFHLGPYRNDSGDESFKYNKARPGCYFRFKLARDRYIEAKEYAHSLQEGDFNCFLDLVRSNVSDKRRLDLCNTFNQQYPKGVTLENVKLLCKKLQIHCELYNQFDDLIFCHRAKRKQKIVRGTISRLDHCEQYYREFFSVMDKEIVYVEDLNSAFESCLTRKAFREDKDNNIKCFYTFDKYYKHNDSMEFDHVDDTIMHHIHTKSDRLLFDFKKLNDFKSRSLVRDAIPGLFEFVSSANIYLSTYWDSHKRECYKGRSLSTAMECNMNNYHNYDMNKAYIGYEKCSEFEGFPEVPSHFYQNTDLTLIDRPGFSRVVGSESVKCMDDIFTDIMPIEGNVYPHPVLRWWMKHGLKLEISHTAWATNSFNLRWTDEMVKHKIYQVAIGQMDCRHDSVTHKIAFKNLAELQDMEFHSTRKVEWSDRDRNVLKYRETIDKMSNQCHISAYVLGYHAICILDKLVHIDPEHIVRIRVDCITLRERYDDLFTLSDEIGDYKMEKKGLCMVDCGLFVSHNNCHFRDYLEGYRGICSEKGDPGEVNESSARKVGYRQFNLISGEAGTGKTTQFFNKFALGEDNRLGNVLMCFPNNELSASFQKKFPDSKCMTYHMAFSIGCYNTVLHKYKNVVIDEASMIGAKHIDHIIKEIHRHHCNLYLLGDFDVEKRRVYQLKPVDDDFFFESQEFNKIEWHSLKLTTNYRQGGDKDFAMKLRQCRDLPTKEILRIFENRVIDYVDIDYKLRDQLLSSRCFDVDDINARFYDETRRNKFKYDTTTNEHCKNEIVVVTPHDLEKYIINSTCVNADKVKKKRGDKRTTLTLAHCITTHLSQGQSYENKVFININRLFDENMIYVALSRAICEENVFLFRYCSDKIKARKYYLYKLTNGRQEYVGHTTNLEERMRAHLKGSHKSASKVLLAEGTLSVQILEEIDTDDREEVLWRERYYINKFRDTCVNVETPILSETERYL